MSGVYLGVLSHGGWLGALRVLYLALKDYFHIHREAMFPFPTCWVLAFFFSSKTLGFFFLTTIDLVISFQRDEANPEVRVSKGARLILTRDEKSVGCRMGMKVEVQIMRVGGRPS